ncbi:MAG: hypothetical protein V1492_05900 [Candidatus Micrarchaeota archaeon]
MENTELILKDLGSANFECRRSAATRLCEAAYCGEDLSQFYIRLGRLLEDSDVGTRSSAAAALTYTQMARRGFKHAMQLLSHRDYYVKSNAAGAVMDYYLKTRYLEGIQAMLMYSDPVVAIQAVWKVNNFIPTCKSIAQLQELKKLVKTSCNGNSGWLVREIIVRMRTIADGLAEMALVPQRRAIPAATARPQEKLAVRRMG